MDIQQSVSLRPYNTFGIDATADWLITYNSLEELHRLVSDEYFQECRCLHIGEGSNLLFLTNFHGIVLRSGICTIEELTAPAGYADLLVGAGMIWDNLVAYTVERGLYGAENLSLIPGQVGSAAIQNIGAYGVEVESLIQAVHTIHRRSGQVRIFAHSECAYAYRDSIFKRPEYADYIVTHVHLRLSTKTELKLEYADLARHLGERSLIPSLTTVRSAIIDIRSRKLPDTKVLGNAGSFFMNPIVPTSVYEQIKVEYPSVPCYPLGGNQVKIPAAWLIDQCGFKGTRRGEAGVYERQALVLVNHGSATGTDIANLAIEIQQAVRDRFGVELHPEVKYIS